MRKKSGALLYLVNKVTTVRFCREAPLLTLKLIIMAKVLQTPSKDFKIEEGSKILLVNIEESKKNGTFSLMQKLYKEKVDHCKKIKMGRNLITVVM